MMRLSPRGTGLVATNEEEAAAGSGTAGSGVNSVRAGGGDNNGGNTSVDSLTESFVRAFKVPQPEYLPSGFFLKPYQVEALNYLRLLHVHDLNCIIADDMVRAVRLCVRICA